MQSESNDFLSMSAKSFQLQQIHVTLPCFKS